MKKLFTLAVAMLLFSCSAPEMEEKTSYTEPQFCAKIIALGEDEKGDYIIVTMDGDTGRFGVKDYTKYKINTTTCDLLQLEYQP